MSAARFHTPLSASLNGQDDVNALRCPPASTAFARIDNDRPWLQWRTRLVGIGPHLQDPAVSMRWLSSFTVTAPMMRSNRAATSLARRSWLLENPTHSRAVEAIDVNSLALQISARPPQY